MPELRPPIPLRPEPGRPAVRLSAYGPTGKRAATVKVADGPGFRGQLPVPSGGRLTVTRIDANGRVRAIGRTRPGERVDVDRITKPKAKNMQRNTWNGPLFAPRPSSRLRGVWNTHRPLRSPLPKEFPARTSLGRRRSKDLLT
jgi:hypothetical protein